MNPNQPHSRKRQLDTEQAGPSEKKKVKISTESLIKEHGTSVVRIASSFFEPDYTQPWASVRRMDGYGTGSVINKQKGWILTCAHVSDPRNYTYVTLANDTKKYKAKVLIAEEDCDMAIVQVDDPEFKAKCTQVKWGDYQPIGKKVNVVGFPFVTEGVTVTSGKVSANEYHPFVHGNMNNLASMTTAPIQSGNSGGPVFNSSGEQVGVAYQSYNPDVAEGAGFFIPIPVIQQFLKMAYDAIETHTPCAGIPTLPITVQSMLNPAMRQHYKMRETQTGVRVRNIDTLAEVGGLQVDDIILKIDGHPIENDGTIKSMPHIAHRLDFNFLITQKQMGENIKLDVLREGKHKSLIFPLKHKAEELKVAGRKQFTKNPSYYIKNGMCFQPLTIEYMANMRGMRLLTTFGNSGKYIGSEPKKRYDEETVILNCVFPHDVTHGFEDFGGSAIVDKINGKPINNMKDLVMAMEQNPTHEVHVEFKNKSIMIMAKATAAQELEILEQSQITAAHSQDMQPHIDAARNPAKKTASTGKPFIPIFTAAPVLPKGKQPKKEFKSTC